MKKHIILLSIIFSIISANLFAQPSADYYNSADGKTSAQLKTALHNIIKNHNHPYTYGSSFWAVFESTDKRPDGKVWDMYSNCDFTFGAPYQDNGSGGAAECQKYNREHSFPQEYFDNDNETEIMKTDLFHIYLTDKYVNGRRGNLPYGEVSGTPTATFGNGSKLGNCSTCGNYSGTVFEPIDEYKGDFARSYFYMAVRYENKIASWASCTVCNGTSYPAYYAWVVDLMLKWHRNDPVSEKETDRNNAVYAVQHNRNPFIDYPALAEYIWGDSIGDVWHNNLYSAVDDLEVADLEIYPNPASSKLFIVNSEKLIVNNVQILDLAGKTIHYSLFTDNSIDISMLQSGIYFIKIKFGEKIAVKRFIVK